MDILSGDENNKIQLTMNNFIAYTNAAKKEQKMDSR